MDEALHYKLICEALFAKYSEKADAEVSELLELVSPRAAKKAGKAAREYAYCSVAARACQILKAAHGTYISPPTQRWFSLRSRAGRTKARRTDAKSRWFSKATEVMADAMTESNYYAVMDEVYNDRCAGGTGASFIGGDEVTPLYFSHIPLGTYAIAENSKGQVDTLVRRFSYTPAQAAQEWGEENLPDKVRDALKDPRKAYTETDSYIHLVHPNRKGRKAASMLAAEFREFEGVYMSEDGYHIIKKEGYFEFPYLVTRFLRGESGSPYGEAPGLVVLPVIRQLLKLERLMDTLAETAAYPRVLQLARQAGQIDMRAGGVTTVSEQEARSNFPKEWATGGRYDIGEARIERKEQQIREAYYNDMLNAVSSVERQMTAAEVAQRVAEKVLTFSAAFTQFTTDNLPAMRRIMAILARRGELPDEGMPEELFKRDAHGVLEEVKSPNVVYQGRIAQAVDIVMSQGADRFVQKVLEYYQATGDQRVLNILDVDKLADMWAVTSGAPLELLLSEADREQMKKAQQAQAQQMQEQQEQAQQMETADRAAGALAKLKGGSR